MGSQRVGHDWATFTFTFNIVIYMYSMSPLDFSSASSFNWGDKSLMVLLHSGNTYLNGLGLLVLQDHSARSNSHCFPPPDSQEVWSLMHLPSRAVNMLETQALYSEGNWLSNRYIVGDFPFVLTSLSWAASAMIAFRDTDPKKGWEGGRGMVKRKK